MKKTVALVLALTMLLLPACAWAIDLSSIGEGLGALFGADTANETDEQIEIDPADVPEGVSLEFYKTMVSYETFFDEYIEFMQTYEKSNNQAELLVSYMDFMTKYVDTMQKLDEINEDELTKEEQVYYAEVHLRINNKLTQSTLLQE